ncbi:hypothetical protein BC938DRAFT_472672 [Jimgerdemannia flammicorona]|uniref:Uncharacterized protein n=1 Tax=Jimgerdemannia flammicorona TaxID=994334 RepID=A0A433QTT5_9FUNG|nr:hypothetical protein BC938DRAFT_472672 [Jimgerdemannia flammicorona]
MSQNINVLMPEKKSAWRISRTFSLRSITPP